MRERGLSIDCKSCQAKPTSGRTLTSPFLVSLKIMRSLPKSISDQVKFRISDRLIPVDIAKITIVYRKGFLLA